MDEFWSWLLRDLWRAGTLALAFYLGYSINRKGKKSNADAQEDELG